MPIEDGLVVWEGEISETSSKGIEIIKPFGVRVVQDKNGYYSRPTGIPMLCTGTGETISEAVTDTVEAMADQLEVLIDEKPAHPSLEEDLKEKLTEHMKLTGR